MTAQIKRLKQKQTKTNKTLTKFTELSKVTTIISYWHQKNEVWIALRNMPRRHLCYIKFNWKFTRVSSCLIVKDIAQKFSDVLNRPRKRAVRISIRWLTGKKTEVFLGFFFNLFRTRAQNFLYVRPTLRLVFVNVALSDQETISIIPFTIGRFNYIEHCV